MTRNRWMLAMAGLLAVAAAATVLLYPVCTIENVLASSYLTPDAKWSVTIYSKTCSCRLSSKTREVWVAALRPISEPAPQRADYSDSEVVFEVDHDNPRLQIGVTSPMDSWPQFDGLSEAEKQHSLLVMCYPHCSRAIIRKQLHLWRGVPVHYLIDEGEDGRSIIQ
ncbi:MAG TPA: hypothetical protein VE377_23340 [Candidatus Dormibacteraeota bacterium]|nr:hypothetical protein [Candidatus Dormibacteraeota bacterium]